MGVSESSPRSNNSSNNNSDVQQISVPKGTLVEAVGYEVQLGNHSINFIRVCPRNLKIYLPVAFGTYNSKPMIHVGILLAAHDTDQINPSWSRNCWRCLTVDLMHINTTVARFSSHNNVGVHDSVRKALDHCANVVTKLVYVGTVTSSKLQGAASYVNDAIELDMNLSDYGSAETIDCTRFAIGLMRALGLSYNQSDLYRDIPEVGAYVKTDRDLATRLAAACNGR